MVIDDNVHPTAVVISWLQSTQLVMPGIVHCGCAISDRDRSVAAGSAKRSFESFRRRPGKVVLAPGLVRDDAHRVRKIHASVRRTHRNVQSALGRKLGE